jgi:hypothetical protein
MRPRPSAADLLLRRVFRRGRPRFGMSADAVPVAGPEPTLARPLRGRLADEIVNGGDVVIDAPAGAFAEGKRFELRQSAPGAAPLRAVLEAQRVTLRDGAGERIVARVLHGPSADQRAEPRRPMRVPLQASVAVAGRPGAEVRLDVDDVSAAGVGFSCPSELAAGALLVLSCAELDGITLEVQRRDPARPTRYGARVVSHRSPALDEVLQRRADAAGRSREAERPT